MLTDDPSAQGVIVRVTLFVAPLTVALTEPLAFAFVCVVVIGNDTDDVPARMVTGPFGSAACELAFVSVTIVSTAAGPLSVTVSVTLLPLTTGLGASANET